MSASRSSPRKRGSSVSQKTLLEDASMAFDFASLVPAGSPAPAVKWKPPGKYNFTFGNNDPDGLAVDDLKASLQTVLAQRGPQAVGLSPAHGAARLQAAARIPRQEAQARRRHRLHGRRHRAHLRLAAGARSYQRRAARAPAIPSSAKRIATKARSTATRGAASTSWPFRSTKAACAWISLEKALAGLKARGVRPKYIYTIADGAESDRDNSRREPPQEAARIGAKPTTCRSSRTTATRT